MNFPSIKEKDFDKVLNDNLNFIEKMFRLAKNKDRNNWSKIKEKAISIFKDLKKNPCSISGFSHGEATLTCSLRERKEKKGGFSKSNYQFMPEFRINQNESELSLLLALCLFFHPCGYLSTTTPKKAKVKEANLAFTIKSAKDLSKVLAFFENSPLQSQRRMTEVVCLKLISKTISKTKTKTPESLYLMSLCTQVLKKENPFDKVIKIYHEIKNKLSSDQQKNISNYLNSKLSFNHFPFSNNNLPQNIDKDIDQLINQPNLFNQSYFWNQQDLKKMDLLKKETKGHLNYLYKNLAYIPLFNDGEGSIYCSATLGQNKKTKTKTLSFKPGITLSQNERDLPFFFALNLYFNCGTLSISLDSQGGKLTPLVRIDWTNNDQLKEIIIPFFEENTFKTKRKESLESLKVLVYIRNNKINSPLNNMEQYTSAVEFLKLRVRPLSSDQEEALRFIFSQVGKNY